jgi:hypothetical protein
MGHIWTTNDQIAPDNIGHHRATQAQRTRQFLGVSAEDPVFHALLP